MVTRNNTHLKEQKLFLFETKILDNFNPLHTKSVHNNLDKDDFLLGLLYTKHIYAHMSYIASRHGPYTE